MDLVQLKFKQITEEDLGFGDVRDEVRGISWPLTIGGLKPWVRALTCPTWNIVNSKHRKWMGRRTGLSSNCNIPGWNILVKSLWLSYLKQRSWKSLINSSWCSGSKYVKIILTSWGCHFSKSRFGEISLVTPQKSYIKISPFLPKYLPPTVLITLRLFHWNGSK